MKFLVASLIALSTVSAVSIIPGDNTGYVEGVSRYIWMPDGNEVPHLVDLRAPVNATLLETRRTWRSRNGNDNQYWLYTRENRENYQLLWNGDLNSVRNSYYDPNRPTKVIAHGWNNAGTSDINLYVKNAFLDVEDCNVIVVDWNVLSASDYITAVEGVPSVGRYLGNFLIWLFDNVGGSYDQLHLVGHSLGAHVVGAAGRQIGGRARRVTGLDPAGPLWLTSKDAINLESGVLVEAIHTDGGVLGIYERVGHIDFYPNGGINPQPGCLISTCSHSRSYYLFAASIRYNHFVGRQCSSMFQVYWNQCSGSNLNMGNADLTKTGYGMYRVDTDSIWPF
ncbi:hypothetical protein ABMA28_007271 [Loxostege sticticalis]|uniref:Lipase domain-containing protein n=1 Tax=Loxostege sticticalis TaxID=481309 RepID=A0ABD0TQ60_LOXSC